MDEMPIIIERKFVSKEEAKEMYSESCELKYLKEILDKVNDMDDLLTHHTFQLDEIKENLGIAEKRKSILISLEEKVDDNMKRLNSMILELKGIIAMVRPMAKKNDWYGEEIESKPSKIITHPVPDEVKEMFSRDHDLTSLVKELPLKDLLKD